MGFGRTYEEFEVGAVYKHWPGKTVTEYDDHLFCLLTMNHHPLHLDAHYAGQATEFGRNVVVGNYIYSLLLGMSVPDVSGQAIANLEVESLRHVAPTFHGDTIYGETTVLGKRLTSKGGLGASLLVYALAVEEIARGWMSVSGIINTHFIVAHMIARHGTEEQQAYFLPRMAAGDVRGAFSMSEPGLGSDVAAIRTHAVADGQDFV